MLTCNGNLVMVNVGKVDWGLLAKQMGSPVRRGESLQADRHVGLLVRP